MESLLLLLAFPLIWPFIARRIWHTSISYQEMAIQMVVVVLLTSGTYFAGTYGQMIDTEVLNGEVTGKARKEVSCEHSYDCNCREVCTGTGSSRSCSTYCDTCYEHSYDVDWRVHTNLDDFNINRIDRQGVKRPPRFGDVVKGQPVAQTSMFANYIKAAPESLFNNSSSLLETYAKKLPNYPDNVYDYHYINRIISVGVPIPNHNNWNLDLAHRLKQLGPQKQANVILVLANEGNPQYADALEEKWLGGKKNDIVVVIGTTTYPKIDWVRVMSWTDNQLFKVQLRDDLMAQETIDQTKVLDTIVKHTMATFKRKAMKDFEYLKDEIDPPVWVMILAIVLSIVSSLGLTWYFHKNDVVLFGKRGYNRSRMRFTNRWKK